MSKNRNIADLGDFDKDAVGGGGYTESSTAPVSPTVGDEWFDLTDGTLYKRVSDGIDALWMSVNSISGVVPSSLLAEYIVTGNAVTSIDFTGLDINTHKSYRVELELVNATATGTAVYMFINGDTTQTDYHKELLYSVGASTLDKAYANAGGGSYIPPSSTTTASHTVSLIGQRASFIGTFTYGDTSAITIGFMSVYKVGNVSNITQLSLVSTTALSIGVGSKVRIYRGDV